MNNQNEIKLSHLSNLKNLNFKSALNVNVDANTHIKNIISVSPYIQEIKTECANNKCNVKGTVGVKIVYIDVDNVFNTIQDSVGFQESVAQEGLTPDCHVFTYNEQISNEINFDEKSVRLNFTVNMRLYSIHDMSVSLPSAEIDGIISKSSEVEASSVASFVDSAVNEYSELSLPASFNKILNINVSPIIESIECGNNYLSVKGKNYIQVLFEVNENDSNSLKIEQFELPLKFESSAGCEQDNMANINVYPSLENLQVSTEMTENGTTVKLDYEFKLRGVILKPVKFQYVEDLFSTTNELQTNFLDYNLTNMQPLYCFNTSVEGEIKLLDDNNVDEIVDVINHSVLLTQVYGEENKLTLEGVLSSTLIYYNDDRNLMSLEVNLPFAISKELDKSQNCDALNFDASVISYKSKLKRGNTLSLDYELNVHGWTLSSRNIALLNSMNLGKNIEYGDLAFQVFVVQEGENLWEFCKRAHVSQDNLRLYNKDLPQVFNGGEKIIVYR